MPPAVIAVAAAVAGAATTAGVVASVGAIAAAAIGATVAVGVSFAGQAVIGGSTARPRAASQLDLSSTGGGRTEMVRQPITTCKLVYGRAALSGPMVFLHSKSAAGSRKNEFFYYVIPLAAHCCQGFVTHWLGDAEVALNEAGEAVGEPWVKNGTRYVWIKTHLGADDQAADQMLVDECEGKWTPSHRLRGICYAVLKLRYDPDVFPAGIPKYRAVLDGKNDILDIRTGTTGWTDNPALCIRDYLTWPATRGGYGASAADLDDELMAAAANICDEAAPLAAGGTEKRYRLWGVADTGETPRAILEDMLSACGGRLLPPGEKWRLFAAAYTPPTAQITESDLRGVMRLRPRKPRSGLFNAVKGVFISPDHDWQPVDYPPVTAALYQAQDNGEQIWTDFPQPFTPSATQAQRLAKVHLNRMRAQVACDMEGKLTLWQVATWEVAAVSNALLGWEARPMRATDRTLAEGFGVDLALTEESPDIYAWSILDESAIQAAPRLSLPDPRDVPAPENLHVAEALYVTRGSGARAMATLSWSLSNDAFVGEYDVHHRLVGAEAWVEDGRTGQSSMDLLDLAPGLYEFAVRARHVAGGTSGWTPHVQEISGLAADPADITGLYLQVVGDQAHLAWDPHPDLDVFRGGSVQVRFSPLMAGAEWKNASPLGEAVPGRATSAVLPALAGTYLVKAIDSTGHESVNAALAVTAAPRLAGFNAVAEVVESPDFSGAKTNCYVEEGQLVAGPNTLSDDLPGDLDDYPDWDAAGGVAALAEYRFAGPVDLGARHKARITARVEFYAESVSDLMDQRTRPIDEWEDMDGGAFSDVSAELQVRVTDDDPLLSGAAWGSWSRFVVGDQVARGLDFRLLLRSGDADHRAVVSSLSVSVDMQDQVRGAKGLAIPAAGATVVFSLPFKTAPNVAPTVGDLAEGDRLWWGNVTPAGFDWRVTNSGAGVAKSNGAYIAQGY